MEIKASPSTRKHAADKGVDLEKLSRDTGRTTLGREDVDGMKGGAPAPDAQRYWDVDHAAYGPISEEPLPRMARIAAAPSFAAQEGVGAAVARFRRASLLAQLAGVLMVAHKACCAGEQVPSTLSEDNASCLPGPSEGLSRAYAPRSAASAA